MLDEFSVCEIDENCIKKEWKERNGVGKTFYRDIRVVENNGYCVFIGW